MQETPKKRTEAQPTPEQAPAKERASALPAATLRHLEAFQETLDEERKDGKLNQKEYDRKIFSLRLLRAAKNPYAVFGDKDFGASFTSEELEELSRLELSAESLRKRLRALEEIAAGPEDKIDEAFRRAEKAGAVTPRDLDRLVAYLIQRDTVRAALGDLVAELREELGESAPTGEEARRSAETSPPAEATEAAGAEETAPQQLPLNLDSIRQKIAGLQGAMLEGKLTKQPDPYRLIAAGSFGQIIDPEEEQYLREEKRSPLDLLGDLYFKGIIARNIERLEKLGGVLDRIRQSGRPIPQECGRALARDEIGDREFRAIALAESPQSALEEARERASREIEMQSALLEAFDPDQALEELALAGAIEPRFAERVRERVGQIKTELRSRLEEAERREAQRAETEGLYQLIKTHEAEEIERRREQRISELAAIIEAGGVASITVFGSGVAAKLKSGRILYIRKERNQDLVAVFRDQDIALDPQKLQGVEVTVMGRGPREEDPEKFRQELANQSLEIQRALEHFTKVPLEQGASSELEEDFAHRLATRGIFREDIPYLIEEMWERRKIWQEVLKLEDQAQNAWKGFLRRVPGHSERRERAVKARKGFAKRTQWEIESSAEPQEQLERALDDESAQTLQDALRLLKERGHKEQRLQIRGTAVQVQGNRETKVRPVAPQPRPEPLRGPARIIKK